MRHGSIGPLGRPARKTAWPRKEIAPSNELRRWYGHVPERFEEFATRYRAELSQEERAEALSRITAEARTATVTLLTATKLVGISEAAVIKSVVEDHV